MKKQTFLIIALLLIQQPTHAHEANKSNTVGLFKKSDPTIRTIKYGNWGSRPYEYAWVASIASIENKRVIDLGVGLPSQYDWYRYVIDNLKPTFYAGIDCDDRIKQELIAGPGFEIRHMDMAQLDYPDKSFDIAYCISTFEHIPYEIFMKSIQEAHRVLQDDGLLIITLDEEWDKNQPTNYHNGWNTLEQSLIAQGLFERKDRSFGLPEFLDLIKNYFELYDDAIVKEKPQWSTKIIASKNNRSVYYNRTNQDSALLNSGSIINSCVSYAVLKKKS